MFLGRPFSLYLCYQDAAGDIAEGFFETRRGTSQTRAEIGEQFDGKREFELTFEPDGYLIHECCSARCGIRTGWANGFI